MTLDPRDLVRSLFVAGALVLACTPTPSEVDPALTTGSSGGPGDTTLGGADSGSGSDTMGGSEDTGPSFDPVCGDGIVENPEECDLGDLNGTGMYCTEECVTNTCGDGYVGPGEACDDGNGSNEDLCTTKCGPTSCGDGVVQGIEECDEGRNNATDGACLPSCIAASCGDTFIHQGMETCDGTNVGTETCASQGFDDGVLVCLSDCSGYDTGDCFACGNGVIESGENCDGTAFTDDVTCDSFAPGGSTVSSGQLSCDQNCTVINSSACTFCGDGTREGPEACDGNQFGGSTCGSFAPNGTMASGGMLTCTAACAIDSSACTYCGDGTRQAPEVCDEGDLNGETCMMQGFFGGDLACAANCMAYDPSDCTNCGNDVVNAGEDCDGAAIGEGSCMGELGPGHGGSLACNDDCTYDTENCCLIIDEPCSSGGECCSGNCTNHMGNDVCRPA